MSVTVVACCMHNRPDHADDPPTCLRCTPEAQRHVFMRRDVKCGGCDLSCLNCGDPDYCCAGCAFLPSSCS